MSLLAGLSQQGDSISAHNADAGAHGREISGTYGVRNLLRDGRTSFRLVCMGDSTADGVDNWPYLLAQRLAEEFPSISVTCAQWSSSLDAYIPVVNLSPAVPRRYVDINGGYCKLPNASFPTPTVEHKFYFYVGGINLAGSFTLCDKFGVAGNRCIRIAVQNGKIQYIFSANGTDLETLTATISIPAGATWLRIDFLPDNSGVHTARFYYSSTGTDALGAPPWQTLGEASGAGVATIYNGTADWSFLPVTAGAKLYHAVLLVGDTNISSWPTYADAYTLTAGAVTAGSTELHVQILGYPGATLATWSDATRLGKAMIDFNAPVLISALGLNQGAQTPVQFKSSLDAWLTAIRGKCGGHIVASSQNPSYYPATNIAAHNLRQAHLPAWCRKNGCGYMDVAAMFLALGQSAVSADGIHPTPEGYIAWADFTHAHF